MKRSAISKKIRYFSLVNLKLRRRFCLHPTSPLMGRVAIGGTCLDGSVLAC